MKKKKMGFISFTCRESWKISYLASYVLSKCRDFLDRRRKRKYALLYISALPNWSYVQLVVSQSYGGKATGKAKPWIMPTCVRKFVQEAGTALKSGTREHRILACEYLFLWLLVFITCDHSCLMNPWSWAHEVWLHLLQPSVCGTCDF